MRYFKIPSDVALKAPTGEPMVDGKGCPVTLTFQAFVEQTLVNDAKFGASVSAMRVGANFVKAVTGKVFDDIVSLSDSDWELVKGIAETPSQPYVPLVGRQVLSFFDAILEAKTDEAKL